MRKRSTVGVAGATGVLACLVVCACGLRPQDTPPILTPDRNAAIDQITANSLRGHVGFLASDLLAGRDTPSVGLDLAAEYIAAQFRRAGLEPAGNDGFFQTTEWKVLEVDPASFRCVISHGDESIHLAPEDVSLSERGTVDLQNVPMVFLKSIDEESLKTLPAEQVEGRAVICALPEPKPEGDAKASGRLSVARLQSPVVSRLKELKALAVVWLDATSTRGSGLAKGRLIDPESRTNVPPRAPTAADKPVSIVIHDPAARTLLETSDSLSFSLQLGPPLARPVVLKNVAGILRGSDPALKDTYVIVSAHYDHVGVGGRAGDSDHIFNGANDDASGTSMVMQLAETLAKMPQRPRRSILFLTFFGEEKGLLGSRYYGRHPLVPLDKTAAMINLEHVGRTDDNEGEQKLRGSLTGFDFTDIGPIFERAGRAVGVEVFKHPRNSDSFFGRSDNQALADRGVPAHTFCVSYTFPDYHAVGDHWDKIDYDNMAVIGKALALGILSLADQEQAPLWNESNTKTARYVKAWKALHGKPPAE